MSPRADLSAEVEEGLLELFDLISVLLRPLLFLIQCWGRQGAK
jgi:hypothetical protein